MIIYQMENGMNDSAVAITQAQWEEINRVLEQAPNWIDRGQSATVLNTIAIFEDILQESLEGCMRPLSSKMRARLFEGYGPLSTFAARTDVAYAFNLLSEADYWDMQIIRKIRNEFAHSRETMGFEKSKIEAMVARMQKPRAEADTAYRWYFARVTEIGYRLIEAAGELNWRLSQEIKPSRKMSKKPKRKTSG